MNERTTVRLPVELLRRAKRKAAKENRTLTSLIEDGLWLVVADKPKAAKRRRIVLPVSSAAGGPMPGFETLKFWRLEELDDLDDVERMKHFRP
jgi:hypothetical protein